MSDRKKNNHPVDKTLSQAAAELGSAGGRVGGPARARSLSQAEREEIARKGGLASQAKKKARKKAIMSKVTKRRKKS